MILIEKWFSDKVVSNSSIKKGCEQHALAWTQAK